MLPDGTNHPGEMTSFNHHALGAVADWMHRTIGGLAPATPGYGKMWCVRDRAVASLTRLPGHATPRGRAAVQWQLDGTDLTVVATVPERCTAVLDLPNTVQREVGPGTYTVTVDYPAADEKRQLAADFGR